MRQQFGIRSPQEKAPLERRDGAWTGARGGGHGVPSVLQMPGDEHGSKGSDGMTAMRFNLVNPSIAARLSRPQRGEFRIARRATESRIADARCARRNRPPRVAPAALWRVSERQDRARVFG